jgi:hypothetical protein
VFSLDSPWLGKCCILVYLDLYIYFGFPWLGKCCILVYLDLYIYFGFPLARLKWSYLLESVRLPLQWSLFCPAKKIRDLICWLVLPWQGSVELREGRVLLGEPYRLIVSLPVWQSWQMGG